MQSILSGSNRYSCFPSGRRCFRAIFLLAPRFFSPAYTSCQGLFTVLEKNRVGQNMHDFLVKVRLIQADEVMAEPLRSPILGCIL
jgi:hypothetical protein